MRQYTIPIRQSKALLLKDDMELFWHGHKFDELMAVTQVIMA